MTVSADVAVSQARGGIAAIALGERRGPLHGVPVSIKDLNTIRGIRTTRGSLVYKDWVPGDDD